MLEIMDECRTEPEYGCFFCRTGYEAQIAREIERLLPMSKALVPVKLYMRRVNGKPCEESVPLFPGYVFARLYSDERLYDLLHRRLVLRVLTDSKGDWRLRGSDLEFAEGLFRNDGVMGFSKAYYDENDRIHVVEGPLANCGGQILRVNRHKRTAQVQMSFQGVSMNVWLGYELIAPEGSPESAAGLTNVR